MTQTNIRKIVAFAIFTVLPAIGHISPVQAGQKCVQLRDRPSVCIDDKKPMPMAEKPVPLPSKVEQVIALAQPQLPSTKRDTDKDSDKHGPNKGGHGDEHGQHYEGEHHGDHDHHHHGASP